MPNPTRLLLRTGASAASLGAFALSKAAELMRGLAEDGQSSSSRESSAASTSPAPERSAARTPPAPTPQARKLEPVVPPDEVPANPAAPAGGDPEGTSGTGPVPRRISNPKAARKVRKRAESSSAVKRLETKGRAKGARPGTTSKAEPTPAELAEAGKGRQPAPMGSSTEE